MMRITNTSLFIAAAFLVACGSSSPKTSTGSQTSETPATGEEKPAATPDGEAPPTPDAAQVAWKDMTGKQKGAYMKKVVVPTMAKVFQEHDAEEFAKVKCTLCHGDGAMDGKFDMPNASLHQLSPGFAEEKAKHPKMLAFMAKRVVPEMAKLLGKEPYDPATGQGFGCLGCHTMKK